MLHFSSHQSWRSLFILFFGCRLIIRFWIQLVSSWEIIIMVFIATWIVLPALSSILRVCGFCIEVTYQHWCRNCIDRRCSSWGWFRRISSHPTNKNLNSQNFQTTSSNTSHKPFYLDGCLDPIWINHLRSGLSWITCFCGIPKFRFLWNVSEFILTTLAILKTIYLIRSQFDTRIWIRSRFLEVLNWWNLQF